MDVDISSNNWEVLNLNIEDCCDLCSVDGICKVAKDGSCLIPFIEGSIEGIVDVCCSFKDAGEGRSLTGSWDVLPALWHYVTIGRSSVCCVSL